MREITAYALLSEADALALGALFALLLESYLLGAFTNPLPGALLALVLVLDRIGLLKAVPKKFDRPTPQAH